MMRALIAMSGGVDSSVAAMRMKQDGWDCIGCTMKLYEREDTLGDARKGDPEASGKTCCSLDDTEDARSVAHRLGMPYYVFNYTREFRKEVIGRFAAAYEAGTTPNPCIDCNRYLKFGKLYERARVLGCDAIVTGHYARIRFENGRWQLLRASDPSKDQSYVLYSLTQEQLAHTRFPLGDMTKTEVRAAAEQAGFINAAKPDSQDICFVPDGDYGAVIAAHSTRKPVPGNFVDQDGRILGRHRGIIYYTIGQRRGLGLPFPDRTYVIRINPADNTVVLGPHEALMQTRVQVKEVSWISGEAPREPFRCEAKLRYRHPAKSALCIPDGEDGLELRFDEPQRAITPGQAAVLYDGEEVLGGGVICKEKSL